MSNCTSLRYGVPHRSLLGSLLFLLYTADVGAVAQKHGMSMHSCVDDTQLYVSCHTIDASTSAALMLCCIEDTDRWKSSIRLKLNADKTQFIWTGSPQQLAKDAASD
jgi:hypothetical protein